MKFWEAMVLARRRVGMTQGQLARLVNVDRTYVSKIERGVWPGGAILRNRIAAALSDSEVTRLVGHRDETERMVQERDKDRIRCRARHGNRNPNRVNQEYSSWTAMRQRCQNPKHDSYKYYGARGIMICDRWSLFKNFLDDMGKRPHGMTLDRIDSRGNYEPQNCRWASPSEQNRDQRKAP